MKFQCSSALNVVIVFVESKSRLVLNPCPGCTSWDPLKHIQERNREKGTSMSSFIIYIQCPLTNPYPWQMTLFFGGGGVHYGWRYSNYKLHPDWLRSTISKYVSLDCIEAHTVIFGTWIGWNLEFTCHKSPTTLSPSLRIVHFFHMVNHVNTLNFTTCQCSFFPIWFSIASWAYINFLKRLEL